MKLTRQDYIDSNIDDARKAGYDCFQLKYDGWWTRAPFINGMFTMASQTEREFRSGSVSTGLTATPIGEFMQGTQWSQQPAHKDKFYIFDLWELKGVDLESASYRDRYALLKSIKHDLPIWCEIVATYPLASFEAVWSMYVATGLFEGVVFRNSYAPVVGPILRQKRDVEKTVTCIGFMEGNGKHTGRLGAIVIDEKTADGSNATVGGGFSDEDRDYIWTHQNEFLGRKCDIIGKPGFESGLLRHPNFLRWK